MRLLHIRRGCHHHLFFVSQLSAIAKAGTTGGTWSHCERCTHWIVTDRQAA